MTASRSPFRRPASAVALLVLATLAAGQHWAQQEASTWRCFKELKSATDLPQIVDLQGLDITWRSEPPPILRPDEPFNATFAVVLDPTFFDVNKDYIKEGGLARSLCLNDVDLDGKPVCSSRPYRKSNACLYHTDVHACQMGPDGVCPRWKFDSPDQANQVSVTNVTCGRAGVDLGGDGIKLPVGEWYILGHVAMLDFDCVLGKRSTVRHPSNDPAPPITRSAFVLGSSGPPPSPPAATSTTSSTLLWSLVVGGGALLFGVGFLARHLVAKRRAATEAEKRPMSPGGSLSSPSGLPQSFFVIPGMPSGALSAESPTAFGFSPVGPIPSHYHAGADGVSPAIATLSGIGHPLHPDAPYLPDPGLLGSLAVDYYPRPAPGYATGEPESSFAAFGSGDDDMQRRQLRECLRLPRVVLANGELSRRWPEDDEVGSPVDLQPTSQLHVANA